MIKCPKCGADNMLNAIFCRNCGDKLDLASLNLENQLKDDLNDGRSNFSKRANQIVGAILAFVIVVLVAGLLIPPSGTVNAEEPSESANELHKKLKNAPASESLQFSEQDLTNLLNKMMNLPAQGEDTILPYMISVSCREDGTVKISMLSTVFGFLPIYAVVTGKPAVAGKKGDVTLDEMSGVNLGWIPFLPADLTNSFTERFKSEYDNNKQFRLSKRNIKSITVTEGNITFEVEKRVSQKKGKGKSAPGAAPAKKAPAPVALPF